MDLGKARSILQFTVYLVFVTKLRASSSVLFKLDSHLKKGDKCEPAVMRRNYVETVLAARRAGIKEVILSEENRKHVEEINENYLKNIEFVYVQEMQQVLDYVLV